MTSKIFKEIYLCWAKSTNILYLFMANIYLICSILWAQPFKHILGAPQKIACSAFVESCVFCKMIIDLIKQSVVSVTFFIPGSPCTWCIWISLISANPHRILRGPWSPMNRPHFVPPPQRAKYTSMHWVWYHWIPILKQLLFPPRTDTYISYI